MQFHPLGLVLLIVLGSSSTILAFLMALYIAGCWKILEKSGLKGWWALIPGAREYQLARCAGREPEGRVLSVVTVIEWVIEIIGYMPPVLRYLNTAGITFASVFFSVVQLALSLSIFIYSIHVFSGLCELYRVRKRWIVIWVFAEAIPALLWGFGKKYQPAWKVEDLNAELAKLNFSGSVSSIEEGLTVNLEERSTVEFFQKKILLRDIHINIPKGHMVLLLGGSGAGKTTFLNAVNGYEKAKAEVTLNSRDMYKQYKRMQYDVGVVPQTEMMRGKDTVLYTMLDAAKLRLPLMVSAADRRKRVEEVMDLFGLKPLQNTLVEKLSGGQKKRLSISLEFISNPSLLILDEPDSGLDGVMARELFEQLRKIADTGRIVIVITHTPDRVIDLFDDVIVLAKDSAQTGRLVFYGGIDEAREFFACSRMEQIVKRINSVAEGGDGLADEYVMKYAEVQNG